MIPEKQPCFRLCHGCAKCGDYYGKYIKCRNCYPHADYCDCPNGVIRWWHRRKLSVTYLRLGRSPYQHGTITVEGQDAIKAEKDFQDYQKEQAERKRAKPKFYWNM